jgi:hypothetical protein
MLFSSQFSLIMDQSHSALTLANTHITTHVPNLLIILAPPPITPVVTQSTPVPIIRAEYCASADPVDLAIVKEILKIFDGNFEVKDSEDKIIFRVKGDLVTLHCRRVLYDAAGNPIVTIRRKVWFPL